MNTNEQIREALIKAEAVIDGARMMVLQGQEYDLGLLDFDGALQTLRAALALPRRNCDAGTPEEQTKRLRNNCNKHKPSCRGCKYITDLHKENCWLAWAQMPYEAEEGGTK